jgi:transposase
VLTGIPQPAAGATSSGALSIVSVSEAVDGEAPEGMLTCEDEVEITALARRGWSISAISRHTGRDRKTVRAWLRGERQRRPPAASVLEPYRGYIEQRLAVESGDPHLDATVLLRELRELGFARSYPTLTRELRRLRLRPVCLACQHRGHPAEVTIELEHAPGAELQLDWKELRLTPWGEPAYLLVGVLAYSGRIRAVVCEGKTTPQLVEALDRLLRALGGTPRRWRTDHMEGAVVPGTQRLCRAFAEAAKHYGADVVICPSNRPQRKGCVEAAIRYLQRSWWRTAQIATPAAAQRSLERWSVDVADQRRRGGATVAALADSEPLTALPRSVLPLELEVERVVSRSALVSFEGNRYSLQPGLSGRTVIVRRRLGDEQLRIVSVTGTTLAEHRRAAPGSGALVRSAEHHALLEHAVLERFSTRERCPRSSNRPPTAAALAAAAALRGMADPPPRPLTAYAALVQAAS